MRMPIRIPRGGNSCAKNVEAPLDHRTWRALVLFRSRRGQPEPRDRGAQTGAGRSDWKAIDASPRPIRVLAASQDEERLPVIAFG
jgi:hypothetical protein